MGPQKSLSARALAATARAVAAGHLRAPCTWMRMPTPIRTKSGTQEDPARPRAVLSWARSSRSCTWSGGRGVVSGVGRQ
eukprot:8509083-Pyramimonas_sp.AAC.1